MHTPNPSQRPATITKYSARIASLLLLAPLAGTMFLSSSVAAKTEKVKSQFGELLAPITPPGPKPKPEPTPTPEPGAGPQSKEECKQDGWKSFEGLRFENQGHCVSYVASNGISYENRNKQMNQEASGQDEHVEDEASQDGDNLEENESETQATVSPTPEPRVTTPSAKANSGKAVGKSKNR